MKILPLGGASEVGASCALLEIAGARILIDAGSRVGSSTAARQLPAFELIGEPPDALVITHAHTDHTGALPLVLPHLGNAEIHMTVGTLHLVEVLQGDAVRLMADDTDTGRLRYEIEDVEAAIARVVPHRYFEPFHPVRNRPDIVMEYVPCGHILGAGMLVIDSPEGRILWTGDYSVTGQPTIGGVDLDWIRRKAEERPFDLVVTEGTYGAEIHPAPHKETERFLRLLERVTAKGGKILIPAFAVGRAQDITLVIRQAKLSGRLAGVPLYLDGMVRPVTSIYENIAHELYPSIPEPLVLLDPELGIFKANSQSRTRILSGALEGPAIVVSSSGMMTGGRSIEYGRVFAEDRRSAILISGYTDEESPGRALLNLRKGGKLQLGDKRVRVRCRVGRYHTSAHADAAQVEALIAAASPRKIALVHGEPSSLAALRNRLGRDRTVILQNGKVFRMRLARPWNGRIPRFPDAAETPDPLILGCGPTPSEPQVRELWTRLLEVGIRDYSEAEIARMFLGPGYSPVERDVLASTLSNHRLYFITGSKIGQRSYRPRPKDEVIDMLVERGAAYQIPLKHGDIVIFSDGSSDLFLAAVVRVEGDMVEAVIPFSSRTAFRRDWVRCKLAIDLDTALRQQPVKQLSRWLEGIVREARALPGLDPVTAYYAALEKPDRTLRIEDALALFFPQRNGLYSSAMHVAVAFALAGARALFQIQADGSWKARTPEEVMARWRAFRRIHYVRTAPEGTPMRLVTGQIVVPNGVHYSDSFEARLDDGTVVRVSYRRVLLPGEEESRESIQLPETLDAPPEEKPRERVRRRRRRPRSEKGTEPCSATAGEAGTAAGSEMRATDNMEASRIRRRHRRRPSPQLNVTAA